MTRPPARAVGPAALALLVVAAALPPPAGAAHAALALEETVHVDHRGDVVRLDLHLADGEPPYHRDPAYNATTANVSVRGHGYEAVVEVRDDGDGHVALLFDTYVAGSGAPAETFLVADPADAVAVRREGETDGLLPAGEYDLSGATEAVPNGSNEDVGGVLRLEARPPWNLTVLRGEPGLVAALETPGDVAAARRDGRLVRAYERRGSYTGGPEVSVPVVGEGETLALALHAPGLAGALAAADGPNATARFESLLGESLSLRVAWIPEPQRNARRFRFGDFAARRVVADPGNDTYSLLVDPTARATPVSGSEPVDVDDPGGVYRTTVAVPSDARLAADGREAATANHTFLVPRAGAAAAVPGRLLVAADGPVAVPVTTTLRPGTVLAVRLRDASGRYVPPAGRVTVGDDGRATATVDVAAVAPGERFAVVLARDGRVVGEVEGRVAAASVTFRDRRVDGASAPSVHVDAVRTTAGAFVALRRNGTGGPVVGASGYLPPGDHADVPVPLRRSVDGTGTLVAVVHWDVDGDREFDAADRAFGATLPSYRTNGTVVADAARLTVGGATTATGRSPGPATESPPGGGPPPATASPRREDVPSPTSASPSGGPGLGPLVALAAVLLAAAAGRRRV